MITFTHADAGLDAWETDAPANSVDIMALVNHPLMHRVIDAFLEYIVQNYSDLDNKSATEAHLLSIVALPMPDFNGNIIRAVFRYNGFNKTELAINHKYKVECYMD